MRLDWEPDAEDVRTGDVVATLIAAALGAVVWLTAVATFGPAIARLIGRL